MDIYIGLWIQTAAMLNTMKIQNVDETDCLLTTAIYVAKRNCLHTRNDKMNYNKINQIKPMAFR